MPSAISARATPSVTVIVLNFNGESHLRQCLPSLGALEYPEVRLMVADNGSGDRSVAYVREHHPDVRVIELGANLGFAAAYNRAVEQVDTEYVALLNNDTHVAPTWLDELVGAAERHHAAAAAATILDWDGAHIDFVGGLPTFIGHAWQLDHGLGIGQSYAERALLFGCGAALLVRRDAYLEVGGFDEDFFAYFEDVDLGWRMNLLGRTTVFAPQALTYHRLHGSFGASPHALRLRLYERNALSMIYKNFADDTLARVLPAAIALTLARGVSAGALDGQSIRFGGTPPRRQEVASPLVATLIALEEFAQSLPALRAKRTRIQETRRTEEAEILALMPEPLRLHEGGDEYRAIAEALIHDFHIAELFGLPAPAASVRVPSGAPPIQVIEPSREGDRVSIIVLTASGATHLPDCLSSLRRHDWPADKTEVIVVDNGSADDPTVMAERDYPGVHVVRTGGNLGFAAGNNAGARLATGDWLAFLNDDTRVTPGWLGELVGVARRRQAAAAGALLVDWSGERVDFAGGLANLEGRGFALHHDEPVGSISPREAPILFASGAATLVRRDVFEDIGGWDEPTFAYYEDVELGWRMWLLGHEVWLAPGAVVHHKHHGTSGEAHPARARAFERNALRMIYALLEDATLQRVLPVALLLAVDRILLATPLSRAQGDAVEAAPLSRPSVRAFRASLRHALIQRGVRRSLGLAGNLKKIGIHGLVTAAGEAARASGIGGEGARSRRRYLIECGGQAAALDGRHEPISPTAAAALLGIHDWLEMLPELSARRDRLQARRRRSDADIVRRFGDRWTAAVPSADPGLHDALHRTLLDAFALI